MKNYSLFSLVFTFILLGLFNNASYVSAFNCAPGELFNTATGQPCNTTIIIAECSVGDLFSSVTGKRCDQMQPNNFSLTVSEKFNDLFKPNFKVGMKGNEVKALQQLLKDEGYYFGKIDGKYGKITARAVKDFQDDNDINLNIAEAQPSTPTSTSTSTTTTTTVPSLTPATIIAPTPTVTPILNRQVPIISGINGPQLLNVNQAGTWSVKAYDKNGENLSYSVSWGEEIYESSVKSQSSIIMPVQQSATFSHSYSQSGTYTPTFIVTNTGGQTAKTSLSVKVKDPVNTNHSPVLQPIAVPESVSVNQSVSFNFRATDDDKDDLSWSADWGEGISETTTCSIIPSDGTGRNWNYNISHAWGKAGNYTVKIRVNDCRGGTASTSFTINAKNNATSPVTVISPNGGETWTSGAKQIIKWQDVNVCPVGSNCIALMESYDIKLSSYPYQASHISYTIANGVYGSSYSWSAGTVENGTGTVSDGSYVIEVCRNGTKICDQSDSYFKITTNPVSYIAPSLPANEEETETAIISEGTTTSSSTSVSTYSTGCSSAQGYSITTGQPCGAH